MAFPDLPWAYGIEREINRRVVGHCLDSKSDNQDNQVIRYN